MEDSYDRKDQYYYGSYDIEEVVWIWEDHGNFSHETSFNTASLPWGYNYFTVYSKDSYGIWANHDYISCDSCQITLKIWPQGGEEDNPSTEWFADEEWDTMDLDSNGQDDSIIFHYDPDTDTEQIDVDVFVLIDKDGSYYDQTFKSYVIYGEEDDWFDLTWTATESGHYTFTVYLYDDNGNLEDIFDAYNVYLDGYDEDSGIDHDEWFGNWEIVPWDRDLDGNDDTVYIGYDPHSSNLNGTGVDVIIFVHDSGGRLIDGVLVNHYIYGEELDWFTGNWSASSNGQYTFSAYLYDSEGHLEDTFESALHLNEYDGPGGFEGPETDEWFEDWDWHTEDRDKDGLNETIVISYDPDTEAALAFVQVEIISAFFNGNISSIDAIHGIYGTEEDQFSQFWVSREAGLYTFTVRMYDSRSNLEDSFEISGVYLDAAGGPLPLEVTSLSSPSGDEGVQLEFEGHALDPNGFFEEDEILFTWDFGDGSEAASGYGLTEVNHTYGDNDLYVLTLTVSTENLTTNCSKFIYVDNVPPVINSVDYADGNEGEDVTFAADAVDVEADSLTYRWDFGDGTTSTGRNTSHAFGDNGNYTVELMVFDDDDDYNSTTFTVTIANLPPVVSFEEADLTFDELKVTMYVGVSDVPADEITVTWYFGDNTSATGETVEHTYAKAGTYDAEVCASDEDGGETCQQFTVTVKEDAKQNSITIPPTVVIATAGAVAVVVVATASSKGYLAALLAFIKRKFF